MYSAYVHALAVTVRARGAPAPISLLSVLSQQYAYSTVFLVYIWMQKDLFDTKTACSFSANCTYPRPRRSVDCSSGCAAITTTSGSVPPFWAEVICNQIL